MFWTFNSLPLSPRSMIVPVERELATAAISSNGNSRSTNMFKISRPTLPVAPTTTTR